MAYRRTALRITLLHLRHILEEGAPPEPEAHLLITHDTLGLYLASALISTCTSLRKPGD